MVMDLEFNVSQAVKTLLELKVFYYYFFYFCLFLLIIFYNTVSSMRDTIIENLLLKDFKIGIGATMVANYNSTIKNNIFLSGLGVQIQGNNYNLLVRGNKLYNSTIMANGAYSFEAKENYFEGSSFNFLAILASSTVATIDSNYVSFFCFKLFIIFSISISIFKVSMSISYSIVLL